MELPSTGHESVLLTEVLDFLAPSGGKCVIDCTTGRAGHARAIAEKLGADGMLVGLDVDPQNLEFARSRLSGVACEVRLFHANFGEIGEVVRELGLTRVDALLADLGVSTNQLFEASYGLSFAQDMPLDMRLDPRLRHSAANVINSAREEQIADILFNLAQERFSRRIARKIVEARRISPITTTGRLAEIVRSAVPKRGGAPEKIDPSTRTFLALRMHVNREMESLKVLIESAPRLLVAGGRMGVISFQSMEDRLAKQGFRSAEQTGLVRVLTKKPVVPTEAEISRNPRSRSAKLRVIEKI